MHLRHLRLAVSTVAVVGALAFADAARASSIASGGLAQSVACPDGASVCDPYYALVSFDEGAPAVGSISFGGDSAEILLTVELYRMEWSVQDTSTVLWFRDVLYTATLPIESTPLGAGEQIEQAAGFAIGSVSGTIDEVSGPGFSEFRFEDLSVSFSGLSCLLVDGQGPCSFDVGSFTASADFGIDVIGGAHDVIQSFEVAVPEPDTLSLVALGLTLMVVHVRSRGL